MRVHKLQTATIKIIVDFLLLLIAFGYLFYFYNDVPFKVFYIPFLIFSIIIFFVIAKLFGTYENNQKNNIFSEIVNISKTWIILCIFIFFSIFLFKLDASRKVIIGWLILSPILLIVTKIIARMFIPSIPLKILIIGDDYKFTQYEKKRLSKQNIKFITIKNTDTQKLEKNIVDRLKRHAINGMVINSKQDQINNPDITSLIVRYNIKGVTFYNLPSFMETFLRKCYIPNQLTNLDYLNNVYSYNKIQTFVKTFINYLIAMPLLILLLLILPFVIYKIKKHAPGSIFFTQPRIGFRYKKFTIYKLRSMYHNSNFDPYTKKNDVRIFPFGKFIRKTRIDELPQILNVIWGDMHMVGPRAEWDILSKKYLEKLPYYDLRSLVKPGITGWAQVNYPYGVNIEDTKQKLMYDLYYVKHWSLALELEIIWMTIIIIINSKGV